MLPRAYIMAAEVIAMKKKRLRKELYDSFAQRAVLYWLIYDEMRQDLGAEKAEALLSRAIYRRGAQKGAANFAQFAPNNLDGLRDAFMSGHAGGGKLFQPEVVRDDAEGLDIMHHKCPLKEAWQALGLPDDEVATMCRIAARIDNGTFEAAGFQFSADTWQPGREGCCQLHIRPGKPKQ
jgi:hypothetical protein